MFYTYESNLKVNHTLKLQVTKLIMCYHHTLNKLDGKNHPPILQSHTLCSFILTISQEIINSIIMNILQPFAHAPANSHQHYDVKVIAQHIFYISQPLFAEHFNGSDLFVKLLSPVFKIWLRLALQNTYDFTLNSVYYYNPSCYRQKHNSVLTLTQTRSLCLESVPKPAIQAICRI